MTEHPDDLLDTALVAERELGAAVPLPRVTAPDTSAGCWIAGASTILVVVTLAACVGMIADASQTRTELLTSTSSASGSFFGWSATGFGLLGVMVTFTLMHRSKSVPTPHSVLILSAIGVGVAFALLGCIIGDYVTRRIADARAFFGRPVVVRNAQFRVVSWNTHVKGYARYATIAPYGSASEQSLPITETDYNRLIATNRPGNGSPYCYPITLEMTDRAVRLVKPSQIDRYERYRTVLCPRQTDDWW